MHLEKILLHDFRNIADAQLSFSPGINCISGSNGAGKTNLLDAVYYLSMTKSHFSASDQYLIRHGCEEAVVAGTYRMDNGCEERVAVSLRKGEKTVRRGEKPYQRLSDHIGLIPVVVVSPSDSALVNDSGDERRKYLNFILSQTDKAYLSHIQQYNQLLLRRNRLLHDGVESELLLETVSEQMEPHAQYVFEARRALCEQLLPITQELYNRLSGGAEEVSMEFRSHLAGRSFTELMSLNAEKDRALGFTLGGIQRDELHFRLDGHPLRKCGSQGQQKTFLLSLKLAQMRFMRERYNLTPILLLDDVFDKLDTNRVELLLSLAASSDFGQIFLTDSNKVRVEGIVNRFKADCAFFAVEGGRYEQR